MAMREEVADIQDFQQLILLDLDFEAFRVLEEEIGEDKAREVFKPHMLNTGAAVAINAQKHLGVTISNMDTLAIVLAFAGRAIFHAPPGKWILTAEGIEWHGGETCYLSGAPNSMRRMFCEDSLPGFLMSYQEFGIRRSCLDKGDGECGFTLFNKADPSIDWRNGGGKDTPIPTPKFDGQKMREYGILALGELWFFPTQALIEWRGNDYIAKLRESMRPLGHRWGRELAKETGENGSDLESLLSVIDTYESIMRQRGRTIYSSAKKHETEITICPFSVAAGEMGASCGEAIGEQCEAFCNGMCEAVSPDFELLFTSKMCAGGQCCHRVIRKKLSARIISQ